MFYITAVFIENRIQFKYSVILKRLGTAARCWRSNSGTYLVTTNHYSCITCENSIRLVFPLTMPGHCVLEQNSPVCVTGTDAQMVLGRAGAAFGLRFFFFK